MARLAKNKQKQKLNAKNAFASAGIAAIMRGSCKLNVGVVGQMGCSATVTLTLTEGNKDGDYCRTIRKNH
jgi:hypothetical protein